jgi:hypothetical protein
MLEYAGQPVMMGNASRELLLMAKEKGWRVTRSNDEDGVAHAISGALLAVAKAERAREHMRREELKGAGQGTRGMLVQVAADGAVREVKADAGELKGARVLAASSGAGS